MPAPAVLRRVLVAVAIGLALLVPAAIQTQPPPARLAQQVAPNAGDPLFVTWTMASEWHAALHHPSGLFAANIFYPRRDAIAWSDNLLAAVPVYGLLSGLLGGRALLAYNLVTLVGFAGVGLAVYLLAKELVGRRGPALVGATVCALSVSRSTSVGHTQLSGFLFVVLGMLALIRFLERRRWSSAVSFGLAAAATWLVTAYYAVMLALVAGTFLLVWLLQRRLRPGTRFWPGLGVAGGLALLVIAPTVPPYARLQRSGLYARPVSQLFRVDWSELWRLPPSLLYRGVAGVSPLARYDKAGLFPGLVLSGLVLAAATATLGDWRRRRRQPGVAQPGVGQPGGRKPGVFWPLAASCVPCLALMLGPAAPGGLSFGFRALRTVPGVASVRQLDRFWIWPVLCLALAAAVGAQRLLARIGRRWREAVVVALVALAWSELLFRPPLVTVDLSPAATAANHALQRLRPGPVLELPEPLGPTFPYVNSARQLRSLIDGNPRVDGYSGNVPPETQRIEALASRVSPRDLVPFLRRYGVRYLLLHGTAFPCQAGYGAAELAPVTASLNGTDGVERVVPAGADVVVVLAPAPIDRTVPPGGPGAIRPPGCG